MCLILFAHSLADIYSPVSGLDAVALTSNLNQIDLKPGGSLLGGETQHSDFLNVDSWSTLRVTRVLLIQFLPYFHFYLLFTAMVLFTNEALSSRLW